MYREHELPIQQYNGNPVKCKRCGQLIGFLKNRNGKWFAINVFPLNNGYGYYGNYGNHGNMKGEIHICDTHAAHYPYYEDIDEVLCPNRADIDYALALYRDYNNDPEIFISEVIMKVPKAARDICAAWLMEWPEQLKQLIEGV